MNDIKCDMESAGVLARGTAMLEAFRGETPNANVAVDLGAIYNNVTGKATAPDSWLYDADFIRFMLVEIKRIIPRMHVMNRLFNTAGCDRFSRPEELVVDMHADFVASLEGYVENTLISPFLTAPNFNKVTRWQGTGTTTGADAYKLNLSNDKFDFGEDESEETITSKEVDGIVAYVHDETYALTVDDLRTVSANNALQEMVTTVTKYDIAYAVDPSEQGVVFYVGTHNAK